jgi:hypothetical protein
MIKYFFITILFFSVGCNSPKQKSADIISPDKMKLVFWDYLRANEYAFEIIKKDTAQNDTMLNLQLQNLIFNHYKISRETFYKSYTYYTNNSNLLVPILDSIIAKHENTRVEFDPAAFLKDSEKL